MKLSSKKLGKIILGIIGISAAVFIISGLATSSIASAEGASSTLSVTVTEAIAIRLLDSTGTSEISELPINIAPTPDGTTASNSFIVDVATSNETGYTLYMNSDYQDNPNDENSNESESVSESETGSGNYTTSLVGDNAEIATSVTAKKNYWDYSGSWQEAIKDANQNDITLSGTIPASLIPAKDSPDTIRDDVDSPTSSSKTNITITANADTNIPAGTYRNRLTFTAVGNEVPTDTFTIGNYTYTKLVQSLGVTQPEASALCNSLKLHDKNWTLPTREQFANATSTVVGKEAVYSSWGSGYYWSVTISDYYRNGPYYYYLYIDDTSARSSGYNGYDARYRVVCVQKQ